MADRKEPHLNTVGALLNESCPLRRAERGELPLGFPIFFGTVPTTRSVVGMRPAFFVHEPGSHNFLLSSSFTCTTEQGLISLWLRRGYGLKF
jgi:hypothetical protein